MLAVMVVVVVVVMAVGLAVSEGNVLAAGGAFCSRYIYMRKKLSFCGQIGAYWATGRCVCVPHRTMQNLRPD